MPGTQNSIMQKLEKKGLGSFRLEMMSLLARSPDPFGTALYTVSAEECLAFAGRESTRTGTKITAAHVLNKMIAVAIAENPLYNQIILDGSLYQMKDIHIANAFLLPGAEEALTYIILKNPHLKSLKEIQEESLLRMVEATRGYRARKNALYLLLVRLYFKWGLYRLVSEKRSFTTGFRQGVVSNIVLSNHEYGGRANFHVLKPVISPMKIPVRIHTYGAVKQPMATNGTPCIQEVFPLTVVADHRILHGVHGHKFGRSLERIASDPAKYLGSAGRAID